VFTGAMDRFVPRMNSIFLGLLVCVPSKILVSEVTLKLFDRQTVRQTAENNLGARYRNEHDVQFF
jgi:hypothetical protein